MLEIIPFEPHLSKYFADLNYWWISDYFKVEEEDKRVLDHPEEEVINKGGSILFAKWEDEIVGTVGLKKYPENSFELIKMGVAANHHGKRIGYHLGMAIIEEARKLGCNRLFLETNSVLTPAINLYKKLGFEHVKDCAVSEDYERCDVAMELFL